jgi:hypothetical protein
MYMSQFSKIELQVHEEKYQLELLYFQVDEGLMCMDIVSTSHILVIIYQSFNVNVFWKNSTTNQFTIYFSSIFLI